MKGKNGFKIIFIWLAIIPLASFWLTSQELAQPASLIVNPAVPREGEPITVTFKLNNPSSQNSLVEYQFFKDGRILEEGVAAIEPKTDKFYTVAYRNELELGKQLNFLLKTQSEGGNYEKTISLPPYPPQVLSSFVSFASFSTSMTSVISSMTYYTSVFGSGLGWNVGILLAAVLLFLLVFLELTRPLIFKGGTLVLGKLKLRFSALTWILLIVFLGMVYTRVVMLIK